MPSSAASVASAAAIGRHGLAATEASRGRPRTSRLVAAASRDPSGSARQLTARVPASPGGTRRPAPVPFEHLGHASAGRGHERRAGRQRLQGHDAERLVERRDHHARGPVEEVAQRPDRARSPAKSTMSSTPTNCGEALQLAEVRATAGDHEADAGHAAAQRRHRLDEVLEPLLVLQPAPRDDERTVGTPRRARVAGGAHRARRRRRSGSRRACRGGRSNADQDLVDHVAASRRSPGRPDR